MLPAWICTSEVAACSPTALCDRCLDAAIASHRPQARVIGACWAERVCRGEMRQRQVWPNTDKAQAIARRLVAALAADPRLVEPLAGACMEGAATWWQRRPARYRL